jgi:hypothetical protein
MISGYDKPNRMSESVAMPPNYPVEEFPELETLSFDDPQSPGCPSKDGQPFTDVQFGQLRPDSWSKPAEAIENPRVVDLRTVNRPQDTLMFFSDRLG